MKLREIIAYIDNIKPNNRSTEEKINWINDLERMIKEDIIDTHQDFEKYPVIEHDYNSMDDELLIPAHYGREIYKSYIAMQIDSINQENNKYNDNAMKFSSAYDEFAKYWHTRHLPLQKNKITMR